MQFIQEMTTDAIKGDDLRSSLE